MHSLYQSADVFGVFPIADLKNSARLESEDRTKCTWWGVNTLQRHVSRESL